MLKKIILLSLLLTVAAWSANAQRKSSKRKTKEKIEWKERLVYGGGLGLSFYNGWNINATPIVGYKITEKFWSGIGLEYYYGSRNFNDIDAKFRFSAIGPKVWVLYYVIPEISIQSEFIHYSYKDTQIINGVRAKFRDSQEAWLVGAGYTNYLGGRFGVRIELFYDLLYDETNSFNLRGNAFFPRISISSGF